MPFSIKYHGRYGLYTVRWSGEVTYEDVTEFIKAISDCDWFRPGLNGLHNWREAKIVLSDDDLAILTGFISNVGDIFGLGRSVNIATDRSARHLVSAMTAARSRVDRERIAVEDLPSALKALGLPEDAEIEL